MTHALAIVLVLVSCTSFIQLTLAFSSNHVSLARIKRTNSGLSLSSTSVEPASATVGVTTGDTKGAKLLLNDLYISTGAGDQILKSVSLRIENKERWGIVGPNGCGTYYCICYDHVYYFIFAHVIVIQLTHISFVYLNYQESLLFWEQSQDQ